MQQQKYVYPVTLSEQDLVALNRLVEKLGCSKADAIRDAIRHYIEYVQGLEVVKIRQNISKDQAKREILEYLKGKNRVYADEVASALRLDFNFVNELLMGLWQEGRVEEA
jgi:metal-sulfur cluster biosynthetic enzyme